MVAKLKTLQNILTWAWLMLDFALVIWLFCFLWWMISNGYMNGL